MTLQRANKTIKLQAQVKKVKNISARIINLNKRNRLIHQKNLNTKSLHGINQLVTDQTWSNYKLNLQENKNFYVIKHSQDLVWCSYQIENNSFTVYDDVTLLNAYCLDGLEWKNNTVVKSEGVYPKEGPKGERFVINYCDNVKIDDPAYKKN